MNIKVTELPMTVDAVRQEVIKKEGEKVTSTYEQKYFAISWGLLIIAFIIQLIHNPYNPQFAHKTIFVIQLILIFIALIVFAYTVMGRVRKRYIKKHSPTNFGFTEEEISKKMIEYMEDMLDKMNEEMSDLDKKKEKIIKEDKETSAAYYQVYLSYNNLIAKIDPQYFSSMEGGDPYRN